MPIGPHGGKPPADPVANANMPPASARTASVSRTNAAPSWRASPIPGAGRRLVAEYDGIYRGWGPPRPCALRPLPFSRYARTARRVDWRGGLSGRFVGLAVRPLASTSPQADPNGKQHRPRGDVGEQIAAAKSALVPGVLHIYPSTSCPKDRFQQPESVCR